MDFKVGDLVRFRLAYHDDELFTVSEIIPDDMDYLDGVIRYEIVTKDSDGDEGTPYPVEDFTPKTIEVGDTVRFAVNASIAGKVVGLGEKAEAIDLLDLHGHTWKNQTITDYRAVSLPTFGFKVPAPDNRSLTEILARLQEVNSQVKAGKEQQRELKKAARTAFQRALRAGTE